MLAAILLAASVAGQPPPDPPDAEASLPEASQTDAWSLDLTVHDAGIGIGNTKRVNGLRLNFRDFSYFDARGIAISIWTPTENGGGGDIYGLALGLPATGARHLRGIGLGVLG